MDYLAFCYLIISAKLFWLNFKNGSNTKTFQNLQFETFNLTSVTGKKALVFLHNKDLINYAVVRLAPHAKKVSINPRVIFDVHLNLNSSGRLVFLYRAEWLQNIFAETDVCDGPSSTLVFAACAESVWGWPNLLKNHFSHEGCSSTCRYA